MCRASRSIPTALKPVRLSLDLKATHALRDELVAGLEQVPAKAAAGAIIDVNTGEVIALESLPDYDPNDPGDMKEPTKINRINVGVYEMGSTFKALSIAMALEFGQGQSRLAYRRARQPALRPLHHPRFPRHASRADACPRCSPIPPTSAPRAWR